ncbi:DUF2019 domain-containing protein [Aquabacter sp. CN5-332]|uniref:DUF2019 domain-containing protein n=1 Tax=Aquabacter sp. CN5-332 TaxID=3156608 RepID=UPI0032B4DF0D
MAITELSRAPDIALVEKFIEVCLEQESKNDGDHIQDYNKLIRRMVKITEEMKSRPGDARRLLTPLFGHSSWQVRVRAAMSAFALAPIEARQVLEQVRATRVNPYAADASGMLAAIDAGEYTPK